MQISERGSQEHRLDYQIAEGTAAPAHIRYMEGKRPGITLLLPFAFSSEWLAADKRTLGTQ